MKKKILLYAIVCGGLLVSCARKEQKLPEIGPFTFVVKGTVIDGEGEELACTFLVRLLMLD